MEFTQLSYVLFLLWELNLEAMSPVSHSVIFPVRNNGQIPLTETKPLPART